MITLEELQRKIWIAFDILRSDAYYSNNHKNYLFKLLFFKRLSDVFEEEAEVIEKQNGDDELAWNTPSEHHFFIPEGCRWNDLKHLERDISTNFSKALTNIEFANPKLKGIFVNNDDNEWDKIDNKILLSLVDNFSTLNLKNSNLSQNNLLGNISEALIERHASSKGMKGEDSSTPPQVMKLLVKLIEPSENMKICDPVCGSGGFLIECINQIKEAGGNLDSVSLYGQEINREIWSIAKINLLLHEIHNFDIRLGDTIRNPQLVEDKNGKLMCFDRVIANPPLNLSDWGNEIAQTDKHERFHYGIPPANEGNFAFIQHILATLNKTGKASVLMSHGILIHEGINAKIRQNIIKEDLVEAVIGLAPNLLYNSGIPGVVLIFNRDKKHKGKILLIDASNEYKSDRMKNYLQDENIKNILSAYEKFKNKEGYAKVVSIKELAANNYIINIKQFTKPPLQKINIKVEMKKEMSKLSQLEAERAKIENELNECMRVLGVDK